MVLQKTIGMPRHTSINRTGITKILLVLPVNTTLVLSKGGGMIWSLLVICSCILCPNYEYNA
ncbi:hypothetical protein Hdeb2414_s0001g00002801 [Helianthus debilis subsp. tardiflorus]